VLKSSALEARVRSAYSGSHTVRWVEGRLK